jgi:hypothetical protein
MTTMASTPISSGRQAEISPCPIRHCQHGGKTKGESHHRSPLPAHEAGDAATEAAAGIKVESKRATSEASPLWAERRWQ